MAHRAPFDLKNSPLNPFLHSEVGLELNGSALTVLSILARLGEDPWTLALSWTKLPKPEIIDSLANRIRQMPLCPQALLDAQGTATRLTSLLPTQNGSLSQGKADQTGTPALPKWGPLAIFYCALAVGMAMNALMMSSHQPSAAAPTMQTCAPQTPPPSVPHAP
jgi:hypothetical protein